MSAITVYDSRQGRSLMVKGLRPGLTERGKIKIGRKGELRKKQSGEGEFQLPTKLNHFVITTMERGEDGNFVRDQTIHAHLGEQPKRIPVRLLYDELELNMQTRFAAYQGRNVWCQGDGERAVRVTEGERDCPCRNLERDYDERRDKTGPPCKINGRLQVMIDGVDSVGGVWVFRTTSWNTVQGLVSSMALISSASGGRLAGIPLDLTIQPKAATDPQGRSQTVYVVGLEFRGTMDELRGMAYKAMLSDAHHEERMKLVHDTARKLIAAPVVGGDEDEDITAEFYPEQAAKAAGAVMVDRSTGEIHEPAEPNTDPMDQIARPVVKPDAPASASEDAAAQPDPVQMVQIWISEADQRETPLDGAVDALTKVFRSSKSPAQLQDRVTRNIAVISELSQAEQDELDRLSKDVLEKLKQPEMAV